MYYLVRQTGIASDFAFSKTDPIDGGSIEVAALKFAERESIPRWETFAVAYGDGDRELRNDLRRECLGLRLFKIEDSPRAVEVRP